MPSNDTLSRPDRAILAMTPADAERFLSRVDRSPGQGPTGNCHRFIAPGDGYKQMSLGGVKVLVHRVAFFLGHGHLPPPGKPRACHSCDWPPCCNPEHLFAGADQDNVADAIAKDRRARVVPDALVPGMRERYALGGITYRELGKEYGITGVTAWLIVNRKARKHIP